MPLRFFRALGRRMTSLKRIRPELEDFNNAVINELEKAKGNGFESPFIDKQFHRKVLNTMSERYAILKMREAFFNGEAPHTFVQSYLPEMLLNHTFYDHNPSTGVPVIIKPENKPGLQTKVTSKIKAFAKESVSLTPLQAQTLARQNPARFMQRIELLLSRVSNFKRMHLESKFAQKLYGKQTAHDVVATQVIPTTGTIGCNNASIAVIASLKALGFTSKTVRTLHHFHSHVTGPGGKLPKGTPHTIVLLSFNDKKNQSHRYLLDPWRSSGPFIIKIDSTVQSRIEQWKKEKKWVEGEDPWSMHITKWRDFTRHVKRQ